MRNSTTQSLARQLLASATLAAIFLAVSAQSQLTVKVDSTKTWQGFVIPYQMDGTTGLGWNSAWGLADLRATWVPSGSPTGFPLNSAVVLKANINCWNAADSYWVNPDGTANKVLEASFYRDLGTNQSGQTITFTGTILSNSLPARTATPYDGWEVSAVIKEFGATYAQWIGMTTVPITGQGAFTVSRDIGAGHLWQYGFIVKGPITAPGSANDMAGVGIVVEDADPSITKQPTGGTITSTSTAQLSVTAVGSAELAYFWKKDGLPLSNGSKYTGVDKANLSIANAQVADSGNYIVTVSNKVTHATVDSDAAKLTVLDVIVTTAPVNQRVEQGSTVNFNVAATSSSQLNYQWKSVINNVTNNLVNNGSTIIGANTASLTLSNVQPANSGRYIVAISTTSGSATPEATLLVKTYAEFSNILENPGFEADPAGLNPAPWSRFEQTAEGTFGKLATTSDTYFGGGNVNVLEGNFVSFTTFHAQYSGIFQDVSAEPGQIFTADMSFYNPSGDPLPGPSFSATNQSYLEVQFRAGGDVLQQYVTTMMDYNTPQNTWITLSATNAGTYGSMPPTSNARYLVAPPGTTTARFQVTMQDMGNSIGNGSLYYDRAKLMRKIPAQLKVQKSGSSVNLSWKSQGATDYQVQYKDSLTGTWQNLGGVVNGTGLEVSKSDSPPSARFYRVQTL